MRGVPQKGMCVSGVPPTTAPEVRPEAGAPRCRYAWGLPNRSRPRAQWELRGHLSPQCTLPDDETADDADGGPPTGEVSRKRRLSPREGRASRGCARPGSPRGSLPRCVPKAGAPMLLRVETA